jgi:hypothetical protein
MEYWTFLVITLAAPFDGYVSTVPYHSLDACWRAAPIVQSTMTENVDMVQCVPSTTPSSSIRPMPRPGGLGDG